MSKHKKNTAKGPFGGMHGGLSSTEKAKDFKGTIKKLMSYIGDYKFAVAVVMLFAIGSTFFNVIGPKILSRATTELFNGLISKISGVGGINFSSIGKILLILLSVYVISAIFNFLQGWIMTGVSQKICFKMRRQLSEKINRMPLSYFENNTVGDILSRITNDVDTLGQSLNQSVTQLITSVTTIIGILIMMLTINPLMTLIIFMILPISAIIVGIIVKVSQKYFNQQQEYLGKINGQIEEFYSGHNVVKAFNRESKVTTEFKETNDVLFECAWRSQFLSGLMFPIMNFVSNLAYVGIAIFGSIFAIEGIITVGDIQAFIQYVRNFTQPITQLTQVSNMLQTMVAASERIFEFLDEKEEEQKVENPVSVDKIIGEVNFCDVRFGYTEDKIIIKDFNCKVKPGQTVAIVGPTGAGKTTMIKLLMRFYDVNSGCIKIDGNDIKNFDRKELRKIFGMVLQETWLYKGTIMENIRYGKLDASDEEVIEAAKAAHADSFIRSLPDGYNMELNEDASNVSQGQKQLLTIARAILANRPILILDEATSSVDTRTEILIQKAMDNLMKGRTSFVIAHRLSTIKDADLILVMKDGNIIEQGTHEELLSKKGFYAELYNSQFELTSA
mgnify:CR=1 FL=1